MRFERKQPSRFYKFLFQVRRASVSRGQLQTGLISLHGVELLSQINTTGFDYNEGENLTDSPL